MADMTAPFGQAPAVAPPVRTDEQIMPHIRWVQIGYLKFSAKGTKREVFGMPILGFGNPNAGSVTSFGTVISFTDAFSASSSDKTWNLILRLKIRRIFCNLESFVGGRLREGDYKILKCTE
nr:hypothetical protein [Tanacetum cinerariifolium]